MTPEPAYLAQAPAGPPEPEIDPGIGDIVLVRYPPDSEPLPAIVVGLGPARAVTVRLFERTDVAPRLLRDLDPRSPQHPDGWYWKDQEGSTNER